MRLLPGQEDDSSDVHAVYLGRCSMSAKVRVFIDALAEHLLTA
ncbi:MAG TPA: hypothetical protein VGC15_18190 [Acetobacteraceae bacterium]